MQHVNWTTQIINALMSDTDQLHVALIQYTETPTVEFSLGTYQNAHEIIDHIMAIQFQSGGTQTGKALLTAKAELFSEEKGARPNARKIIVLFTDGLSTDDPIKHAHELREIGNVQIFVVSVGSDGFESEMNRIAGTTSNVFGFANFFLPQEFLRLLEALKFEVEEADNCMLELNLEASTTTVRTESVTQAELSPSIHLKTHTFTVAQLKSQDLLTNNTLLKHKIEKNPEKNVPLSEHFLLHLCRRNTQIILFTNRSIALQITFLFFVVWLRPLQYNFLISCITTINLRFTTASHISTKTIPKLRKPFPVGSIERSQEHKICLSISSGQCPREILFIVDSSGSVQRIYDQQKDYILSLLNELVALVQFAGSSHQKVEWTFDTYNNARQIEEALAQVRHFTGTTYIGRALEASINVLGTRRRGTPTIVILMSDGFSQDDASKPAEEIRQMSKVDFYAVSMSKLNNFEYLAKLTDDPSKVYIGQRGEDLKQELIKTIRCRT
ncbi:unnamed protein product [Thelazia callipaeda]|uniref:VWFA domain-containing protein n=1 Tax=Thelazia callipaeda TaxID=103827 RepID=A0A0N5CL35_THECL|nr:unnamed protein product [Thelazia callipaeda]